MTNRDVIVQNILLHELITKRQPALEQIVEGLKSMNFFHVMASFREMFESVFVFGAGGSTSLTAQDLLKMLQKRDTPDDVFAWLKDYVKSLDEEGELKTVPVILATLYFNLHFRHAGRKKFLQFCTGSDMIPPIGFETSQIKVSSCGDGVSASTCFQVLTLPRVTSYATLKTAMDAALSDGPMFNTL